MNNTKHNRTLVAKADMPGDKGPVLVFLKAWWNNAPPLCILPSVPLYDLRQCHGIVVLPHTANVIGFAADTVLPDLLFHFFFETIFF